MDLVVQTQKNFVEHEELYDVNHDVWVGREATRMGFPIAGCIADIYEDAVILIPTIFRFDWSPERVTIGRVLDVTIPNNRHNVYTFVVQIEDGTQITCTYGASFKCFFALPENTEDLFR